MALVGFLYNIACVATLVTGAWLSELTSRRFVVIWSLAIFMFASTGIIIDTNLVHLQFYMFLAGATHGGRTVVATLYMLELMPMSWRKSTLCI